MAPINLPLNLSRDDIDSLLFTCFRAIIKFQQAKVRYFDLNYDAIFLLQFLRHKSPATMGDISKEMQMPVSTATRVVDRLAARGMVSRLPHPQDKRVKVVTLEPLGEELVRESEDHSFDVIIQNFSALDEQDRMAVLKTARLMEKILQIPEDA